MNLTLKDKIDFLSKHEISRSLSPSQLEYLANKSQARQYNASDIVASTGELAESCYLLVSGTVDFVVSDEVMYAVSHNNFFGIMGYYSDDKSRPATYKSIDNTILLEFPYSLLDDLKLSDTKLYVIIDHHFTRKLNAGLIKTNQKLVKDKILIKSLMNFFSAIIIVTLLSAVLFLVSKDIGDFLKLHNVLFTCSVLIIYLLIFLVMILRSHFSFKLYGVELGNWKRDIVVSLMFTSMFLLFLIGIKLLMINFWSFNLPLFEFNAFRSATLFPVLISQVVYAVFVIVQEFVCRGIIQGVVMHLAETKYEKIRGILIIVLIFSCAHLGFPSYMFAVLVVVPALFWSLLYEFQGRRLLGVIVSHSIIGIFAISILGFGGVLLR